MREWVEGGKEGRRQVGQEVGWAMMTDDEKEGLRARRPLGG